MKDLLREIETVKRSKIRRLVDSRINEFRRKKSKSKLFSELCFCIMTANFNAERSMKMQDKIGKCFINLPEKALQKKLKDLGYRYHNRAEYIVKNREHKDDLEKNIGIMNEFELREWLVKNIKGFGMKEASHFMRNIGFSDVAIIDFHIVDLLARYGIIKKPEKKSLSRKQYLEIESILREIAKKSKLNLAELDLYLWYIETGKILK